MLPLLSGSSTIFYAICCGSASFHPLHTSKAPRPAPRCIVLLRVPCCVFLLFFASTFCCIFIFCLFAISSRAAELESSLPAAHSYGHDFGFRLCALRFSLALFFSLPAQPGLAAWQLFAAPFRSSYPCHCCTGCCKSVGELKILQINSHHLNHRERERERVLVGLVAVRTPLPEGRKIEPSKRGSQKISAS